MKSLTKAQLAAENVELRKNNSELRAQLEAQRIRHARTAPAPTVWGERAAAAREEAKRTGRVVKV